MQETGIGDVGGGQIEQLEPGQRPEMHEPPVRDASIVQPQRLEPAERGQVLETVVLDVRKAEAHVHDPQAVAEAFLAAIAASDLERSSALIDDEIDYINVGLPSVRGRDQMARVFGLLDRPGAGFEVYLHSISAHGPVVLTERTDVLLIGRLRIQFWVWGRFDVHHGKITLWRDSFDFLDVLRGTVRGLAGMVVPSLRPKAPSEAGAAPGR